MTANRVQDGQIHAELLDLHAHLLGSSFGHWIVGQLTGQLVHYLAKISELDCEQVIVVS